ncbi:MAG: type II secretion system protein [Candidatus Pacebacteria bacterium]|nr:type II secretion system protein [Candidatus Paceibacterota bacterium]
MQLNKLKIFKRGFTLLELLVVVAIIGILSAIVLTSIATSRAKSIDSLIQQNLRTVQTQAEVYFQNNKTYTINSNGSDAAAYPCSSASTFLGMYKWDLQNKKGDPVINRAIGDIMKKINNTNPPYTSLCAAGKNSWAVAIRLKSSSINNDENVIKDRYWCVDSRLQSKEISGPPSSIAVYEGFFPLTYKCP